MTQLKRFSESVQQVVLKGNIDVPMLPEVAHRVLSLSRNSESTASQMAELIETDQALAGHVMRIANSVAYSPVSNIVSLKQAVTRLGMKVVSEIALSAVLSATMFKTPGFEDYVEYNWQHAIATSLWSKEVANMVHIDTDVAFLAALLHSIGRPALLQAILELGDEQKVTLTPEYVHRLENKYCHQVTELVLSKWNLPKQVIESTKPYDEVDESDDAFKIAAVVDISTHLASYMLDIAPEEDTKMLMDMLALEALEMNQTQIEQLLSLEESVQQRLDCFAL